MFYANKKVSTISNQAKHTAEIVKKVKILLEKKLIEINDHEVLLYPQIWKDQKSAENWMKCLHHYCTIKNLVKKTGKLQFKNIATHELMGTATGVNATTILAFSNQ